MTVPRRLAAASLLFALVAFTTPTETGPVPAALLAGLSWRNLGPFRAGRVSAVSGAIGGNQLGVFYMGLPMGGVWKTTSAGETWYPVFDSVKEASTVGAIAVAPSNPDIIYVGMGDLIAGGGISEGNGVYKSTDAGCTWQHLGLDDTKQIPSILVDPKNPDLVLLAAQGDVHKKSDTRGVYRSTNGGQTWTKTLYVDDSTGAQKIAWADDQPGVLLATTVRHYNVPPRGLPRFGPGVGPGGGGGGGGVSQTHLFKSTDEGVTWKEITGGGLPRLAGRTSVAIANNTNAQRMFLIQNTGLWRSDDAGATWRQMDSTDTRIRNGQGGYNCGVYVDPKNPDIVYTVNTASYKSTRGLLFAGTESGMYVSFDDGDHWQSLQLNLPNTSYRDIVIHGNDLVVGTYGRGIWVLDDISPLREMAQVSASEPVHLFAPGEAVRVRRNVGNDTPFPPEVPHALNPPDGALIYYTLATKPAGPITLEVLDATGTVVRHMTSGPVEPVKEAARPPEPNFWIAPPFRLPAEAGGNRTNWDLRADAPHALTHSFEINANPGLTPPSPQGPLVPPGTYTLRLTVDGKTYTRPVTVVNDPRSPATAADVRAQYALATRIVAAMQTSWDGYGQVAAARAAAAADTGAAVKARDSTLAAVGGAPGGGGFGGGGGGFRPGGPPPPTFAGVNGTLGRQLNALETGDLAPTGAMQAAYAAACKDLASTVARWKQIKPAAPLVAPSCGG